MKSQLISEGKHWPEDYAKTAYNAIKSSSLGQQSWYRDDYIKADVETFIDEFKDLSHKNSNLGYFMAIIKMFIAYSGTSKQRYQEFIETKLDNIIRWFKLLVNDSSLESQYKEKIKSGMSYEDFEKMMQPIEVKDIENAKNTKFEIEDRGYEIERIDSYEQLNAKFGGNITGYDGKSEWCHTNGESTYESWTSNGKYNFFVIYKKDFKDIKPPKPTKNAYDEYGLSMMAILVKVIDGSLERCTLRWNHIIEPSLRIKGRTVDQAFIEYNEISKIVGFDVRAKVLQMIDSKSKELQKIALEANKQVSLILSKVKTIDKDTIPETYKSHITKIVIPSSVTSIGQGAFPKICKVIRQQKESLDDFQNYAKMYSRFFN